jgi:anti-anti-sigma factor
MSADFNILSEMHDDTLIIKTDGYINNIAGEKIVEEFLNNFKDGMNKVVMDLEKTKVVNSFGISYLIDVIEKLSEKNARLIFTNLDLTIEKTFDTMGIFQFAEKADSTESALG